MNGSCVWRATPVRGWLSSSRTNWYLKWGQKVSNPAIKMNTTKAAVRTRGRADSCRDTCALSPFPIQCFMVSSIGASLAGNGGVCFPGFWGRALFPQLQSTRQQHCGPSSHMRVERLTRDDHLHPHLLHALCCSWSPSLQRLITLYAGMSHCVG